MYTHMRIISSFVFMVLFCDICSGQDWKDEQHVWDEEKGKWVVSNKAHGRVVEKPANNAVRPFAGEPWERYLPKNVKYGKRQATQYEIDEAQRKLWAKGILQQRAAEKSEARRKLIAHRRASGWYGQRHSQGLNFGASAYNRHMQNVSRYRY